MTYNRPAFLLTAGLIVLVMLVSIGAFLLVLHGFVAEIAPTIPDVMTDIPTLYDYVNGTKVTEFYGLNSSEVEAEYQRLNAELEELLNDLVIAEESAGLLLTDFDHFGSSVTNIGDLDGDGVNDIVVGARLDDTNGLDSGAIHIIFLNSNGTPKSTVEINSSTTYGPILSDGDNFGWSVANIGDLDGNGVDDIAVGAYHDDE